MTKYREKSVADLAWGRIRREVLYRINLAKAHWGDEMANRILPKLQAQFEESLSRGVVLELESGTVSWIDTELAIEAPDEV